MKIELNHGEILIIIGSLGLLNKVEQDEKMQELKNKILNKYLEELKKEAKNDTKRN